MVSEVRGEIEPCGCPTLPFGGFERREKLLEELRQQTSTFHLDAGELLLKGFASHSRPDATRRAQMMVELSAKVGVDAWTAGPTDLIAIGLDGLQTISVPPVISATWTNSEGEWILPPSVIIEKNDLKIGVVGLSANPENSEISYLSPQEATTKALQELPSNLDLIVGLGSITDEQAESLARSQPGIAAIFKTRGESYDAPRHPNQNPSLPLIIEAPDRGRYIQNVFFRIGTNSGTPLVFTPPEQKWRDLLVTRRQSSPAPDHQKLEKLFAEEGEGRNICYGELAPLNESYEGTTQVAKNIERFKKESLQKAAKNAKKLPKKTGYASSGACTSCHHRELARWAFSDHAKAYQSLIMRNEKNNPECLPCHTTGFGEPNGLGELTTSNIRKYKAVQCESCHGPMLGHPDDETIRSIPITAQSCTSCHDEANSPEFDFDTYLLRGSCQDMSKQQP